MVYKIIKGAESTFEEQLNALKDFEFVGFFGMSADAAKFAVLVKIKDEPKPIEPAKPSAKEIALKKAEEERIAKKAKLEAELAKLDIE